MISQLLSPFFMSPMLLSDASGDFSWRREGETNQHHLMSQASRVLEGVEYTTKSLISELISKEKIKLHGELEKY